MECYESNYTEHELNDIKSIDKTDIKHIYQDMINEFIETIKHNNKKNVIYTTDIRSRFHWIVFDNFIMFGNIVEPRQNNKNIYYNQCYLIKIDEFQKFNMKNNLYYLIEDIIYINKNSLLIARCLTKNDAIKYMDRVISKYIQNVNYDEYLDTICNIYGISKTKSMYISHNINKCLNSTYISKLIIENCLKPKYMKFKKFMSLKNLQILEPNSNVKTNIYTIDLSNINQEFINDIFMYVLQDICSKQQNSPNYDSLIQKNFSIRQCIKEDNTKVNEFKYLNDNTRKIYKELILQILNQKQSNFVHNEHYALFSQKPTQTKSLDETEMMYIEKPESTPIYYILDIKNFKNIKCGFFNTIYCIKTPIEQTNDYESYMIKFFHKHEVINEINKCIIKVNMSKEINEQVTKYYCKAHEQMQKSLSEAIEKTKTLIYEGYLASAIISHANKRRVKLYEILQIDNETDKINILGDNLNINRKISEDPICDPNVIKLNIYRAIEYLFTELIFYDKPYYPIEYESKIPLSCESFLNFHASTKESYEKMVSNYRIIDIHKRTT